MGGDRYFYGPKGEYLGRQSDDGPGRGDGIVILLLLLFLVLRFFGCVNN